MKDNSKQVTWNAAASFYGVGITAQTGWNTRGRLQVIMGSGGGNICGTGGHATTSSAYQLVVKP